MLKHKLYLVTAISFAEILFVSCSSKTKARTAAISPQVLAPSTSGVNNQNLSATPTPVTPTVVPPSTQASNTTVWNPFNTTMVGDQPGPDLTTFQVSGVAFVAWGQQRCASIGDSLGIWNGNVSPQPALNETHEGRFRWAELRAQQYSDYYRIARGSVDINGNTLPLYPSFGVIGANGSITLPSGKAPSDPASTVTQLYSGYQLVAFCVPSCFRGDQSLIFASEGDRQKYLAMNAVALEMKHAEELFKSAPRKFGVQTLDASSSLGSLQTGFSGIDTFVSDLKVENPVPQLFYQFITDMNHSLTVTESHGLLLSSGDLRTAKDLSDKMGNGQEESLLNASGRSEKIVKINKLNLPERSYNLRVKNASGEAAAHVLVSHEGLLSADAHLQDQLSGMANNLNESLDRENIPLEVLPR